MMNREEFARVVRAMRAEGIPLTMPNLMVRTELPRATLEDWLADLDNPAPVGAAQEGTRRARRDTDDPRDDVAGRLLDRMADLKDDLARTAATTLVKDKLGITDDPVEHTPEAADSRRTLKDLRWGAGLGLLLGPLGLFYAAPVHIAGIATAAYVALWALSRVPILGQVFGYLLPVAHLAAAVAGAAYTWRYNRAGRRSALLPDERSPRRRRRGHGDP